jgi:subtilisin family serine protease
MTYRSPLAACCLAVVLAACADQPTASTDRPPATAENLVPQLDKRGVPVTLPQYALGDIVPGHYNVVFRANANPRAVMAIMRNSYGLSPSHEWSESWIQGFSAKMDDKQLDKVKRHPHVAFVNPVVRGRMTGTLYYPFNWGLDRIDQRYLPLDKAYTYTDSAPNVNVYVLDTGIRYTHTDFEGRAVRGIDVVTSGGTASDCHGHGTFVAAIVGGREYGVAKKARLHSVRVMNCSGAVYSNDAITAANWVTNNHRKPAVANFSAEFPGEIPELDQAIYASIQAGVTWVVAAGNRNADACNYTPSHTLGTITVGATDSLDYRAIFAVGGSNWGACLNLFAPGKDIESAGILDDWHYRVDSGTSFAAPHVAGIAANYLGRNPTASVTTVKSAIVNNATTGVVKNAGTGSPNRLSYSRI